MARGSSPFEEVERLFDRMGEMNRGSGLAVDLEDTGDAFVLTADLPGFDREDIDVELREGSLRISASRDESASHEDESYIHRERTKRSINRSVSLPEPVDKEETTATFKNGVLTVQLPKSRASEDATSIDIE
ncbi:Hsp20/alpha crystallin family protein [Halobacterium zhouii]|uniref:Hsp20/alpha crystallin family protein n=1 Tax=Halobacterium zhouii TaxID=2902624 RepID=UPI001E29A296|nr:Hsp20/alpha crystallin family protein [Halobacterium zhouii]